MAFSLLACVILSAQRAQRISVLRLNPTLHPIADEHDRLIRFMVLCRTGKTLEFRHALVIEALCTHDVETARQAMLDQVNETRETIKECITGK